jgi:SAM-dependent methyltransferase
MIGLKKPSYPYMEEVNEGILRQFQRLPATGRVLDVGCGRAALGEAIRGLGWEVWGIERAGEACATARERIDRLIDASLLELDKVSEQIAATRFDALVFSDVLEHLYDPLDVLESYLRFVKPGGKVLISVPNAVVWTNRLLLCLGQVRYTDTGVMDRTHIRFFTFRTARQLVEAAGCHVDRIDSTPHVVRAFLPLLKRCLKRGNDQGPPNPRALIDSRPYRLYMKYFYPVEYRLASLWRTMLAFRIIVVGTKPATETVHAD